ncbi:hypothetical protein [Salipiger mucosus]|uniref:hypothetical protein n=1 Tax=Salipiger mucosus TaxID=263378 RepID=UPI00037B020D|nr:hypothetical protein [Salipiger mucosus]
MERSTFKHLLWSNDIQFAGPAYKSRAGRMFSVIMPIPLIRLASKDAKNWVSLHEAHEVERLLPAGDMVDEELDIDVPQESLVVVENPKVTERATASNASYQVGHMVAQVLNRLVSIGDFGVTRETTALYGLATYFVNKSRCDFCEDVGIKPNDFCMGMASELARTWSGAKSVSQDPSGFFLRPNFLETSDFCEYLSEVDPSFVKLHNLQYPESRLGEQDTQSGVRWTRKMIELVRHDLDTYLGKENSTVNLPRSLRFNR